MKLIFKFKLIYFALLLVALVLLAGPTLQGEEFIADYKVSKESALRSIPVWAIEKAKSDLHILYCGTSHSTQVMDGMRGLMQYKTGDDTLFAFTYNGVPVAGKLDIHYNGASGTDLSNDGLDGGGHTAYYNGTVSYLDSHSDVNVVMWSWCSIEGHDVQRYLDNFAELISMYSAGGSKGRTAANEVKFVFMTGYARGSDSDTPEPPYIYSPYQNHKRITDYCRANNYFCLDYWSQDCYEYETDAYKPTESGNDNIQHKAYFDSHSEGVHWFATRNYSSGAVEWPAHCEGTPQHITSNRRAYAAWWIWARLAGWGGGNENKADFNADNNVDILWRNHNTGENGVWFMDNTTRIGFRYLPTSANTNWCIVGAADFNQDGKTDILWRNIVDGKNCVWFMNNANRTGYAFLNTLSNTAWGVAGLADFNQDGHTDIMWRNNVSGENGVWYMNGTTWIGHATIPTLADINWVVGDVADFNSDGSPDILWRNTIDGRNGVWFLNGVIRTGQTYINTLSNTSWVVGDAADFNGDGKPDILWRNTADGQNGVWYMNGTVRTSITFTHSLNTDWYIGN